MARLCVITGLAQEADCLATAEAGAEVLVLVAGTRFADIESRAEAFLAAGGAGVLSFGLAGGLREDLTPGTIVVAERIVTEAGASFETDTAWRTTLLDALAGHGAALGNVRSGAIAAGDRAVPEASAKQVLAAATGALAVDMESHEAAALAAAHGVPFLALRVIVDEAARSVPMAARDVVGERGEYRYGRLAGQLLRRPQDILALLGLARRYGRAMRRLRRVAAIEGPTFRLGGRLD